MSVLYIVQGFLGAGKTTWSKVFAQSSGAVRLNADEWCMSNFAEAEWTRDWDGCFSKSIVFLWEETEHRLSAGEDVILDFGFWSRASRDDARDKARRWQAELRHYYLVAPDEVLIERVSRRGDEIARRNVENFHKLKACFEPPAADENAIIVDTAAASVNH